MYWVNGEQTDVISLQDRSLAYGDGGFTTMKTIDGKIEYWTWHRERMQACLRALAIPEPDWEHLHKDLILAAAPTGVAGIKLLISRGSGGRGYHCANVAGPTCIISTFAYPEHYKQWQRDGISLGVCGTRLGINPLLAGHKHNNRLEQVLARQEIAQAGFDDGVTLDIQNYVIETTSANVFWVKDGVLFTPKLTTAGVAGVMRRAVLAAAQNALINVEVGRYMLNELLAADEIFITNSLLGVAPVAAIDACMFQLGNMTKQIQGIIGSC